MIEAYDLSFLKNWYFKFIIQFVEEKCKIKLD